MKNIKLADLRKKIDLSGDSILIKMTNLLTNEQLLELVENIAYYENLNKNS